MRHRESQLIHTTSILLALLAGIPAGAGAQGWMDDG
jgi:hypothetical protein